MAFFDELSKRMSGVAQSAQKAAEIARLQRQVNLKQDEFDALFREIGQLYYSCSKRGEQPGEEMADKCGRVDGLAAEIEGLKLKLDDLKEIRRCAVCGSIQNNTSKFCADCGAKLEERAVEEEPQEAPAEAAEAAQEDEEKEVYINWPEAGEKAEEEAEEAGEGEAAKAPEEEKIGQ